MAPSLSNVKVFVSLVAENFSLASQRRGYAAASASQGLSGLGRGSGKTGNVSKGSVGSSAENSWIPDPVTGYYKPANRSGEVDVAELREFFLKQKITSQN